MSHELSCAFHFLSLNSYYPHDAMPARYTSYMYGSASVCLPQVRVLSKQLIFLHGDLFLHCVRPITMFNCYFPSVLCPELRTNKISPRHVNRRNVVSLARQRRTLSVINWQLSTVKLK